MSDISPEELAEIQAVVIPVGACRNCGYDGPEHILTLDESTLWECIKCGTKMKYTSPGSVTQVAVSDGADMTQVVG